MPETIYYETDEGDTNKIGVYHTGELERTHIALEMSTHQSTLPLDAVKKLINALEDMLKECAEEGEV